MKKLLVVLPLLALPVAAQDTQPTPTDPSEAREALFGLAATADDTKLIALYEQAVRWSARYDNLTARRNLDPQAARIGLERLIDHAVREDDGEKLVGFYELRAKALEVDRRQTQARSQRSGSDRRRSRRSICRP